MLGPFSLASWQGAENLLTKALRKLEEGDEAATARLVERAASLPYDPHEDAAPAAIAAGMLLFMAVSDELESSDEDDSAWLDAALAVLRVETEGDRFEMRDTLAAIRQDNDLTSAETQRIEAAVRDIPEHPELRDMGDLPVPELAERVTGILRLVLGYRAALEGLADPS